VISFIASPKFFPCASIALGIAATCRYAAARDPWHAVYWFLGTAITVTATFFLKGI